MDEWRAPGPEAGTDRRQPGAGEGAGLPPALHAGPPTGWWVGRRGLRIGAHRGDCEAAPENTMAAFAAAAAAGADYVEFDVQRSADGVLVVIHDPTLERTTDGHGPVADRTAAELLRLDAGGWFAPAHAGERIPLFEAVLEWLSGLPSLAGMVEIKAPGLGAEIAGRLARLPFRDRLAVCSFSLEELSAARRVDEGLPRFLIAPRGPRPPELAGLVASARRGHADGVNLPWSWLDADLVARLHDAGLMVGAGTANQAEVVERLVRLGVDFVDSDRPRLAVAARDGAPVGRGGDRRPGPDHP
jgi:glycerophosphoryl diester phosphodiesterase